MAFYDKNPRYNALREKAIELALKNLEQGRCIGAQGFYRLGRPRAYRIFK